MSKTIRILQAVVLALMAGLGLVGQKITKIKK